MANSRFEDAACKAIFEYILKEYNFADNYKSFGIRYFREKSVITECGTHGRLDLCIELYDVYKPLETVVRFNVECKSSTADLASIYGKNWNEAGGNFICYPRDMFQYVTSGTQMDGEFLRKWLMDHNYPYVGIMALEKDGTITLEKKALIVEKAKTA